MTVTVHRAPVVAATCEADGTPASTRIEMKPLAVVLGFVLRGFGDEALEDCPREGVGFRAALGMPLYAEDELRPISKFDRFDDVVIRRGGDDTKTVTEMVDRLMVAGVDGQEVVTVGDAADDLAEQRLRFYLHFVRDGNVASGFVIHLRFDVLDKRATAPDVQRLDA